MSSERELNNSCESSSNSCDADRSDPFGSESCHGTARYVGTGNNSGDMGGTGTAVGVAGTLSGKFDFQTMKAANNQKSSRIELPRSELIKMLSYLEGELQAREVVIAALRNERVKHHISHLRSNLIKHNDPNAALFRDIIALGGNLISRQSSTAAVQADMEVNVIIEQQIESLYQMVHKQRVTHERMVSIITNSLEKNQRMLQELEEEKRKHEHDTAQGDDITYGLEMERTKLRQELEAERAQTKKLEKDNKKLQETLDFERGRQKQIVLLLIAERKKIFMKFIEEGKRSEDLAQILSEEKQRSDSIAEGLEEESKKSLRMEAELEKQAITFENERKTLRLALAKEEKKSNELDIFLSIVKAENETLRNLLPSVRNVPVPIIPAKSRQLADDSSGTSSTMVNIAKIVQPTATVTSVPVSGPTTGIARSISPGQTLRSSTNLCDQSGSATSSPLAKHSAIPNVLGSSSVVINRTPSATSTPVQLPQSIQQQQISVTSTIVSSVNNTNCSNPPVTSIQLPATALPGTTSSISSGPIAQSVAAAIPINNIIASVTVAPIPISTSAIAGTRGVPPPIPPNKPVVPPKREPSISRIGSLPANNSK